MNNKNCTKTIEALRNGEHRAFESVFMAYYEKVKTFIFGYLKSESDAEELTEDLFVALWERRESIDTSRSFNSYLHTIARNSALNFLKRKYLHAAYIAEISDSGYSSTSEEDLIAKELGL